jgi:aspartate/methionine/tyrosine aminotransferase
MMNQQHLEWVEPGGGCVCFPRIKSEIKIDVELFYEKLLENYGTYVGKGRWFEEDDRYMRIGYGWETTQKLEKGLANISTAIDFTQVR